MADVKEFYDSIASEYHSRYNIGDNPTYKKPIADYFRLQIVLRILAQNRCRSVFEVGVGDGTPLSQMSMMGLSVSGCDISERMVESTRNKLHNLGLSEPRIWKADISNAIELAPALMSEPVDALVALGVMPHVEKDQLALKNMRTFLKPGGKLLIEFRNALFSLFTFNRMTHDFIVNELLQPASDKTRYAVAKKLESIVNMELPPIRENSSNPNGPSYDEILSKYHNPLEIPDLLTSCGFKNVNIHWYHFHAAPPMLQDELSTQFDRDSINMEHLYSNDWRGHFLCSALLVEADAA